MLTILTRYAQNQAARQAEIARLGGGGTAQDAVTIAREKLAQNKAILEQQKKARLIQSQQARGQQAAQQQQTALTELGTRQVPMMQRKDSPMLLIQYLHKTKRH